jgi:hypothetical protein
MHVLRIAFVLPALLLLLILPNVVSAATVEVSPGDDLESTIAGLQPGDTLQLADGTYEVSGRFSVDLSGTANQPIIIEADDGASPLINRANANQNIWDLNVEYVTIRGLRFSGGSAGLRFESASNVTLENCEIFDTADVAIRMNSGGRTYSDNDIIGNHIHDTAGTGEGMYLGCNNDGCRLVNSRIERNYVHHTNGPNVSQGDGIEIKEGSYGNVVRDNVIHDTNYPCLIVYSTVGNGAENVIDRNVMWNCGDNGMQVAADATIVNNIVLGAGGAGIAMQPHQNGSPQNLTVAHNTVINSGDAIALRGAAGTVTIANNAVYSNGGYGIRQQGDLSAVTISGNVGVGGLSQGAGGLADGDFAADFVDASYDSAPSNVFPADGGALPGAGTSAHVTELDFNGLDRNGATDVGAYLFDANGNSGWTIAPEFKQLASPDPDPNPDAGSDAGTDAGSTDAGSTDAGSNDAGTDAEPSDTGGSDTGSDDAGSQMDASTDDSNDDEDSTSDDGCGCAQSGESPRLPLGSVALLLFAGGLARLRRR